MDEVLDDELEEILDVDEDETEDVLELELPSD